MKLEHKATLGKSIKMMEAGEELPIGRYIRVTGRGHQAEGGEMSKEMQYIDTPIVSNAICNSPKSYDGKVTTTMFCAGQREGGLDVCQGYGGSPAVIELKGVNKVVGIVSWGEGCGRPHKYGVYTRVSSISKWAKETMLSN